MGVVTLRPDGLHSADGWVAVNGATGAVTTAPADFVNYLKDENDGTYVESPTGNMRSLALHFANFAIPARAQLRGITPRARVGVIRVTDGLAAVNVRLGTGAARPTMHPTIQRIDASTTLRSYTTGTVPRSHSGDLWTQLQLDQIQLHLARTFDWDRDRIAVHALYLDVDYNEAPTLTITGPPDEDAATGNQVTSTSTPLITLNYTDPEGDGKERHHLYVIPESVYTAPGFIAPNDIKAGDSPPAGTVWYQRILSSATEVRITTPIPNGKYRVYGAAADAGSTGRYGPTAFREWTQAVPAPPAPTLAVSVDVANARVALSATTSASTPNTEFLRWETLVDGQWIAVRGYERVTASPGTTVVAYDRDARPGTSTQYRVRAGRVVAGADVVSAAAEASATQTLDSWWLQDPYNASFNMRVKCYRSGNEMQEMASKERQAVFPVLGAKYPVTVADVIEGEVFDATFTLTGDTELANFERLRSQQRVLLLRSQHGRGTEAQWYVRFGETRRKSTLVTQGFETTPVRRVTVECHERGRP